MTRRRTERDELPLRRELETLVHTYYHPRNEHKQAAPTSSTTRRLEEWMLEVREHFERTRFEWVADEELSMHYFDSRGVHRVYGVSPSDGVRRMWRHAPGFSQRFAGTFGDDGDTIEGLWKLSRDGTTWDDDLKVTFRPAT